MRLMLFPAAILYGILAVYIFRRFTDETRVRSSANRMLAHAMELRLFLDSPRLVFHAQRQLLRENLHLQRLVALPTLLMALFFTLLYPQLNAMFGYAPLKPGVPVVVTARTPNGDLQTPAGMRIDTPPVRSTHNRTVSWQITPLGSASGTLRVTDGRTVLSSRVSSGTGFVSGWSIPFTAPAIEIPWPQTHILGLNWTLWFFIAATASALVSAR